MITMYIDGVEVVGTKNFTITEEMLTTPSVVIDNIYPKSWESTKDYVNNFYYPADYSKCLIYKDNDLIFSGVVKNTAEVSLNPREPKYCSLELLDFKLFLSEGELLDFVITDKTIAEAIAMVVDAVSSYGFVVGNIDISKADDVIGAYSTLDKSAYDVLQYLSEISLSRWTTRVIDENTVAIDFYEPETMTRGTEIKYTTAWAEANNLVDMTFSYGTYDYRNKQVMTSSQVIADIDTTDIVTANGYDKNFVLTNKVAYISEITVDGITKTFTSEELKSLGITADFYYKVGENTLESDSLYTLGTTVAVTYTPIVQGRQVVTNTDEVQRINTQLNRKGVIARYENRDDIQSNEELNTVGQNYLKYKGQAEIILTLVLKDNPLYEVGNIVYFDAPILNLKKDYMVKSKRSERITTPGNEHIFYKYELTSSFNDEQAINYFDNQRAKNGGNIGAGEFINRNIDINRDANIIWQNLTITELTIEGDNVLNAVLDAPLTK